MEVPYQSWAKRPEGKILHETIGERPIGRGLQTKVQSTNTNYKVWAFHSIRGPLCCSQSSIKMACNG